MEKLNPAERLNKKRTRVYTLQSVSREAVTLKTTKNTLKNYKTAVQIIVILLVSPSKLHFLFFFLIKTNK